MAQKRIKSSRFSGVYWRESSKRRHTGCDFLRGRFGMLDAGSRTSGHHLAGEGLLPLVGNIHGKHASLAQFTFYRYFRTDALGGVLHDGQAEPCSARGP